MPAPKMYPDDLALARLVPGDGDHRALALDAAAVAHPFDLGVDEEGGVATSQRAARGMLQPARRTAQSAPVAAVPQGFVDRPTATRRELHARLSGRFCASCGGRRGR